MTDLPTLLKRLQEAEGPQYALDDAICRYFYKDVGMPYQLPCLTSSIDAALALVEKRLGAIRVPDVLRSALLLIDKLFYRHEDFLKRLPIAILIILVSIELSELEGVE